MNSLKRSQSGGVESQASPDHTMRTAGLWYIDVISMYHISLRDLNFFICERVNNNNSAFLSIEVIMKINCDYVHKMLSSVLNIINITYSFSGVVITILRSHLDKVSRWNHSSGNLIQMRTDVVLFFCPAFYLNSLNIIFLPNVDRPKQIKCCPWGFITNRYKVSH